MEVAITQERAKLMIRDYLRESGKETVARIMPDINRSTNRLVFTPRALEIWLNKPGHKLQPRYWEVLLDFIQSKQFKQFVSYANEVDAGSRLIRVGDGLVALYTEDNKGGEWIFREEQIERQGQEAIKLLEGNWQYTWPKNAWHKHPAHQRAKIVIEAVPGKRYAKFFLKAYFQFRQASASGFIIYKDSENFDDYEYFHNYIVHLWYRKDPNTGTTLSGKLTYLKQAHSQPEFSIQKMFDGFLYEPNKTKDGIKDDLDFLFVGRLYRPNPEQGSFSLLEDVLPHGLA